MKTYVIMPDEFINFTQSGEFISVKSEDPRYVELKSLLLSDKYTEDDFMRLYKRSKATDLHDISSGALVTEENKTKISVDDGVLVFPTDIQDKVREFIQKGADWTHLENFWRRCLRNPDRRSVDQLHRFIVNHLSTIMTDGCFIGYKYTDRNFFDQYTHTLDNHPGRLVELPREYVEFDPNITCAQGLHVASLQYAQQNKPCDGHVVVVKVDPADVVSVPVDYSGAKIRVCRYLVLEEWFEDTPVKAAVVDNAMTDQVPQIHKLNPNRDWTATELEVLFNSIDRFNTESSSAAAIRRHEVQMASILNRDVESIRQAVDAISAVISCGYVPRILTELQAARALMLHAELGNQWKIIAEQLVKEFDLKSSVGSDLIRKLVSRCQQ